MCISIKMLQRNINNVIYLFITTILLYAFALHIPDDQKILGNDQLNYISDVVCSDLQDYINTTSEECIAKFWSPTISSKTQPSSVVIKCRSAASIKFQIPPSKYWQLVMLLPEPTDRNVYYYDIEYVLIEPMIEYEKLPTMSKNYTIWNTDLVDGQPLLWRGGDKLPQFNESARPEHINYNITVVFNTTLQNENPQLNGFFQWNTSDVDDVCFDVVDSCTKSDTAIFVQKPEVLLKGLNMNATCNFKLSGLYGTTDFEYNTPACDDLSLCMSVTMTTEELLKLRNPPAIDLMASAESDNTWSVRVNWTRPVILPDKYNVTLRAKYENSLVVPGTATDVTFTDVVGEDFYNVSIYSVLGNTTHISKRDHFPPRREAGDVMWTTLIAAASVCAGLAIGAALVVALCRRRRDYPPPLYDFQPEEKIPKEIVKQTKGPELEYVGDDWEVQSDKVLLLEVIGEGAFGVVRRGTLSPEGRDVAVKMLKDYPSLEEVRAFRSEMELMKSVGIHPHIVSLVGCCSGKRPLIVAEYCSRGDLLSYLRYCWDVIISKHKNKNDNNNCIYTVNQSNNLIKNCKIENENSKLVVNKLYDYHEAYDKDLTPVDLLSFCRQIAKGMKYLASNRVVHRDLAARNILVTSDKTLKIADFGLSRDIYEENQYKQKRDGKMPIKWMAPESLMRMVFTTHSDVWSFGVVMWEVTTVGGTPYPDIPTERLLRMLRSGYRMPRPSNASEHIYELMLSCWRANPRERPTFAKLQDQLDALLQCACADQYLTLELEGDAPPTPRPQRYFKTLISSGKLPWLRRESYERPVKVTSETPCRDNHYTLTPNAVSRQPA